MSYYRGLTRSHAFVPGTLSPISPQPQWSPEAIADPILAGGPMGAYYPTGPARRHIGFLGREPYVPGLGALGLSIPGVSSGSIPGLDVNSIVQPIVNALGPTMDGVFNKYMPRVEQSVSNAINAGISRGVTTAMPQVKREVNAMVEPYKKYAIAYGLISAATLAGVLALLAKKGK